MLASSMEPSSSPSLSATSTSSSSSLSPLSLSDTSPYTGISPPISYAHPTDDDIYMNSELDAYLKRRGDVYEEIEGHIKRNNVIDKLSSIVTSWATDVGTIKGIDDSNLINGGGIQLKIFGSTRLGVHTPDADIDVLCIAPSYVTRSDFFTSFCTLMTSRSDVSMLSAIPEAYTPVVKFNIDGQAIDMIFVSLTQKPTISPALDVLDVTNLYGLDEQGVRSLNGPRVADAICKLVPNFDSFCTALRFLKHWARQRGLYSNVLGFLGGVNYAILVAFISQRYPNACPATIVSKFFQMYSQWRWPMPVMLNTIEDHNPLETGSRYLPVWNPKLYPKDGAQLMPIITPAYPAMNSAYNVGLPQFRMILHEIVRGQLMFQNHRRGDALWEKLCQPAISDFFDIYPRYVQIDISAKNAHDHRSWFGWCESRLRQLILSLEQPPYMFCHPTANCFHRCLVPSEDNDSDNDNSIHENTSFISSFFIGLTFTKGVGTMDITPSIQDFIYRVTCWIGKKEGMEVSVSVFEQSHAPDFVFETKAEPSNIRGCTPAKAVKKSSSERTRIKRDLNGNNDDNDYNNDNNDNDLYNGPSADFASYFEVKEGEMSPLRKAKDEGISNTDNDSDPATDTSSITRCKSPEIEKRSWSAAVRNGYMNENAQTIPVSKPQPNSHANSHANSNANSHANSNANSHANSNANSKNEYKHDGNHKKGRVKAPKQNFPSATNKIDKNLSAVAQAKENNNNKDTNSNNNSSNNTKIKNANSNSHTNSSKGNSNSQQRVGF